MAGVDWVRQDYVILAWGDIAINLDVSAMFQQHLESGADITVVCSPEHGPDNCALHQHAVAHRGSGLHDHAPAQDGILYLALNV